MKVKMKSNITLDLFDVLNPSIIQYKTYVYNTFKYGKLNANIKGFKKNCQICIEITGQTMLAKYTFYYTLKEFNAMFDKLYGSDYKVRCIHCNHYNKPMYCKPCFAHADFAYFNYEDTKNGNETTIRLGE